MAYTEAIDERPSGLRQLAHSQSFGKLIISGEHAVVYGRAALVKALPFVCDAELSWLPRQTDIRLVLPDLNMDVPLKWNAVKERVKSAWKRHADFLKGNLPITEVLAAPSDLVLAAAASIAPVGGWQLKLKCGVPVGAGLGSSAAVIVAVLKVLNQAFDLKHPAEWLWKTGREIEALQHGRSSGVDVAASLYGGVLRFQSGNVTPSSAASLPSGWQLWYSGKPVCGTGETVSAVAQNFPENHPIWAQFADTTAAIEAALANGDKAALHGLIRQNHHLLCNIGVVPEGVQKRISAIEASGGAAKICGAGAIRGGGAGVVLVLPPKSDNPLFEQALGEWSRLI